MIRISLICILMSILTVDSFSPLLSIKMKQIQHIRSISRFKSTMIEDPIVEKLDIPSYSRLLSFGGPTLAIWLLQPILSLIDSVAVGLSTTSIAELAAIGPGIVWIDSTSYLCQFIGIATTNLYAVALGEKDESKARKILSHATIVSIFMGVFLTIIQYTFSKPMITIISGTSQEIVPFGIIYSKIRYDTVSYFSYYICNYTIHVPRSYTYTYSSTTLYSGHWPP